MMRIEKVEPYLGIGMWKVWDDEAVHPCNLFCPRCGTKLDADLHDFRDGAVWHFHSKKEAEKQVKKPDDNRWMDNWICMKCINESNPERFVWEREDKFVKNNLKPYYPPVYPTKFLENLNAKQEDTEGN